jgi:hypothetical protein
MSSPGYTITPCAASSYGESAGSPKVWSSGSNISRGYSVAYPEQEAGSPIGISSYTGVAPSSHASSPIDIPPFFPTMSALSFSGECSDRTLPNPTSRGQLLGSAGAFPIAPTDLAGPELSLTLGQRVEGICGPKGGAPTKSEASAGIASSSLSRLATNRRPLSCQEMAYGFVPVNVGASRSPRPATSTTTYLGTGPTDSGEPTDATATSGDGGGLMPLDSSSCDTNYGYTTREKERHRSTGSNSTPTGTLANGLPYTRPGTPVALLNAPYNLPRKNATTKCQASAAPLESPTTSLANPDCC